MLYTSHPKRLILSFEIKLHQHFNNHQLSTDIQEESHYRSGTEAVSHFRDRTLGRLYFKAADVIDARLGCPIYEP